MQVRVGLGTMKGASMRTSKLAQKEIEALSPGEHDLLRYVRRLKKPISIQSLARQPEFHGWDHESLKMLIDRLQERNMVTWDGREVGPSYAKAAEELSERVFERFVQNQE